MPCELITGKPGNGKTLYALQYVQAQALKKNRPVFYARIRIPDSSPLRTPAPRGRRESEADYEKRLAAFRPWTPIDAFEWMNCPAGSIVVIDECQQSNDPRDPSSPALFGVRQRGAKVPPWAAAIETHRHGGVDLVIITQDPMLIDTHERKLVDRHFHVVRWFGKQRSTIHEFTSGVRQDVDRNKNGSIRHEWKYPKEVYSWYESAEVHTIQPRIPMRVWLLVGVIVGLPVFIWYTWHFHLDPSRNRLGAGGPVSPTPVAAGVVTGGAGSAKRPAITAVEFAEQYVPRVAGLPHTAPVYDELTKPVIVPYPAACIKSRIRCQCYTQQGSKLETTVELCGQIAEGGFFVAWQLPPAQAVPLRQEPRQTSDVALQAPIAGPVTIGYTRQAATPSASILPEPMDRGENAPPGRARRDTVPRPAP